MNRNQKEYEVARVHKLFYNLQDDILDEFNKDNITEKEMINIINWCKKMKAKILKEYEEL